MRPDEVQIARVNRPLATNERVTCAKATVMIGATRGDTLWQCYILLWRVCVCFSQDEYTGHPRADGGGALHGVAQFRLRAKRHARCTQDYYWEISLLSLLRRVALFHVHRIVSCHVSIN